MAKNGLLIVTNLSKISLSLSKAIKYVPKILYIQLFNQHKTSLQNNSRIISNIYLTSLKLSDSVDVRVILSNLKTQNYSKIKAQIDLLIFDHELTNSQTESIKSIYQDTNIITLDKCSSDAVQENNEYSSDSTNLKLYDNVVLGGTFDRSHIGHKILLSEAVLKTKKRLIIGVTDVNMVQSKKLSELILPVDKRIEYLREFLINIDNTINYEIVAIQDPFGPTKYDPNIQLIVVSAETLKGGQKVNELRKENNLLPLEIHCIDLIELCSKNKDKEMKISSSNQRMDLLGTRLKTPALNKKLSKHPYIIGLVGGIASGKSIMSERFRKMGAKIIDCDKLAHQIYEPGEECYDVLKKHFGSEIIGDDRRIDRKKLGQIVFNDTEKLEELNAIVWPLLLKYVKKIINESKDNQVIIVEAAILLKAGWEKEFHEIWSCIIPVDEAIRRIMLRNNLTEDEAKKRVNVQINNHTIVKNSHIVFSSLWSYEFSQIQAEKAWKILMDEIKKTNKL